MPVPEDRISNALALEAFLVDEALMPEQAIVAAELQRQLEDRIWSGNRKVLELLGRPPIRAKLYTLLGELVVQGRAEDTPQGMMFHRQAS